MLPVRLATQANRRLVVSQRTLARLHRRMGSPRKRTHVNASRSSTARRLVQLRSSRRPLQARCDLLHLNLLIGCVFLNTEDSKTSLPAEEVKTRYPGVVNVIVRVRASLSEWILLQSLAAMKKAASILGPNGGGRGRCQACRGTAAAGREAPYNHVSSRHAAPHCRQAAPSTPVRCPRRILSA